MLNSILGVNDSISSLRPYLLSFSAYKAIRELSASQPTAHASQQGIKQKVNCLILAPGTRFMIHIQELWLEIPALKRCRDPDPLRKLE